MLESIKNSILNRQPIEKNRVLHLTVAPLDDLCAAADEIRKKFCGDRFDICTIVNGKNGRCPEDCKFCAQSAHYASDIVSYQMLGPDVIVKTAKNAYFSGIHRYSVVTSGKKLAKPDLDNLCVAFREIKKRHRISLCASLGLLSYEELVELKKAGAERYHCNIETSRKHFTSICTTHSFDEKIETIKNAQKAGLEVCSGCIIGLGETWQDRIDMAFTLKELGIESVPLNVLNPVPGTPMEKVTMPPYRDIRRTAAIFRFILPNAQIRMAGGRKLLRDHGKLVFSSGANAAITGNMLTTEGVSFRRDMTMIKNLGYQLW